MHRLSQKDWDKFAIAEDVVLKKVETGLLSGKLAQSIGLNDDEKAILKSMQLLTMKPILYVLNKKAGGKNLDETGDTRYKELLDFVKNNNAKYVVVDAGVENELKDLDAGDKETFRLELGAKDDGIDNLIKAGYETLDLITFLTTGEDESRAWTTKRGSTAPIAGTSIHNDFKDKFIRAEVIMWNKLLESGGYGVAREKGWVRTEGKDYVVQDGDVIEFKI